MRSAQLEPLQKDYPVINAVNHLIIPPQQDISQMFITFPPQLNCISISQISLLQYNHIRLNRTFSAYYLIFSAV